MNSMWVWVPLVVVAFGIALWSAVTWIPERLVARDLRRARTASPDSETPTAAELLEARSNARSALLQSVSVLGIAGGLVITVFQVSSANESTSRQLASSQRQAQAADAQQQRDRFNAAAENLSHKAGAVRLGAIYSLSGLPKDDRFRSGAARLLTLYANDHAAPGQAGAAVSRAVIQPDVDAALAAACEYSHDVEVGPLLVLDGRNLVDKDLPNCSLSDASFREVHGVDPVLIGAILRNVDFEAADLVSAEFADADLRLANFGNATLTGAGFHSADLREADLRSADLSGADLSEAKLQGAWADSDTKWPDGFDPEEAGVTLVRLGELAHAMDGRSG